MKEKTGPILMIMSALLYSLGGLCYKYIDWIPFATVSARAILCIFVMGIYMIIKKHRLKINKTIIFGAVSLTATGILYSYANKLTTAGNAIIIQFVAPAIVVVFNMILLKKRPKKLDIITCILVFAGILIFFIDAISAGNMLGNFIALLSAFTYAAVFMMNDLGNGDSLSAIFFSSCLSCLTGLPFLIKTDIAGSSSKVLIAVLVLGIVQQGIGHIFFAEGITRTSSITASLVSGVEPVMNPVLVALFYGETLTPLALVGAAIVLVSIMYYSYRQAVA